MFPLVEKETFKMTFKTNFSGLSLEFTSGELKYVLTNTEWSSFYYITEGFGEFGGADWVKKGDDITVTLNHLAGENKGLVLAFTMDDLYTLVNQWNEVE